MSFKGRFSVPLHVKDGIIYDADAEKVKLWGVNYYAPFNHNFYNIEELGKSHFDTIDEDIRQFEKLGVELVRMHLYDREISDQEGNIVENKNMRVRELRERTTGIATARRSGDLQPESLQGETGD